MYYVGVDIAKEKHYVCILDDTKELACKPFWIYSDILGLRELLKRLAELSLDMDDFIIGIESTGAFSENFYSYITDADYKVILLNSYQKILKEEKIVFKLQRNCFRKNFPTWDIRIKTIR